MAENRLKPKKIPERRCTGCGISKPKKELLRVVRSPDGEISVDLTGKASGRGAYICRDPECLRKAQKTGKLSRSLDSAISEEIFQNLLEKISETDK